MMRRRAIIAADASRVRRRDVSGPTANDSELAIVCVNRGRCSASMEQLPLRTVTAAAATVAAL